MEESKHPNHHSSATKQAPPKSNTVSVAIVLELENGNSLEDEAFFDFVRDTAKRIDRFRSLKPKAAIEIAIAYRNGMDQRVVRQVAKLLQQGSHGLKLSALSYEKLDYYEVKMLPVFALDAEILVYCDSDCEYSSNWPIALIDEIVAGNADITYGATFARIGETRMERASALAWFFPIDVLGDPMKAAEHNRFYANNFALRRKVLEETPFHRDSGSRTKGGHFIKAATNAGFSAKRVADVIAHHKQYESFREFLARGCMLGADSNVLTAHSRTRRRSRLSLAAKAPRRFYNRYALFLKRVWHCREFAMDQGLTGLVHMLCVGTAFHLTTFASQLWHAITTRPVLVHDDYRDISARAKARQIS